MGTGREERLRGLSSISLAGRIQCSLASSCNIANSVVDLLSSSWVIARPFSEKSSQEFRGMDVAHPADVEACFLGILVTAWLYRVRTSSGSDRVDTKSEPRAVEAV